MAAQVFSGGATSSDRPGATNVGDNVVPDLAASSCSRGASAARGVEHHVHARRRHMKHPSPRCPWHVKKAHRHPRRHVMCVTGTGYSLLWYEGDDDWVKVDWKHGTVFAPPDAMFHQHFNTSAVPARYLATAYGSLRYPFTEGKRRALFGGVSTSVKQGGNQIEYADQSPRVPSCS